MVSTALVTVCNIGEYRSSLGEGQCIRTESLHAGFVLIRNGITTTALRSHNVHETRILSNLVRATVAARKFSQRSLVREGFACLIPF